MRIVGKANPDVNQQFGIYCEFPRICQLFSLQVADLDRLGRDEEK